jgi:thiamine kinase-like enzyme
MATSADVKRIVTRLEETLGAASTEPVPLEGGITNRNYRVRLGGEEYVVRLPGKDTELLGISREAERIANSAAADLGIAPRVAAGDDECLVTAFIVSRPVTGAELAADSSGVARSLRAFHESGPELPVRFWVPELVEQYAEITVGRGRALPAEYEHAREVARRIAAVRPLSAPAPCHNDLLTANLIRVSDGGGVMLVDWEYAGMGDPFFDLGNLSINNEFDEAADERVLSAYLEAAPDAGARAALKLMRAMSDIREATWGVVQGAISELDFDFAGYAAEHFARLRATTSDPRFDEYLYAASA